MIPGKIVITDKVYFKPNGIEAPVNPGREGTFSEDINYIKNVEKYITSRKLVEVENDYDSNSIKIEEKELRHRYKNNQPCIASIKDNKATITELTK